MKINKISYNATDIEEVYDNVNSALRHLGLNFIGKSKIDLLRAKRNLESIRPHLKNRGIR